MEDTLLVGDFLFANKLLYGPKLPFIDSAPARHPRPEAGRHHHLQVSRATPRSTTSSAAWPSEGQTVELIDDQLFVDGVHAGRGDSPKYVFGSRPDRHFGPFTVPEGHVFMMGDNRDNSADSRAWGPLDKKLISGKAMFIYFSWNPRSHSDSFLSYRGLIR